MPKSDQNEFVRNLLGKPREVRLEGFRKFTARHPLLLQAFEKLWCAIRDSNPGSIIFIYGPAGVGKTTLLNGIKKHILEMTITEMKTDLEKIPVVFLQLPTPTSGSFDWKDYFRRLLIELEEPLIDKKLDMEKWAGTSTRLLEEVKSNRQLLASDKPPASKLRLACEKTLRRRGLLAVLLDDAQHLGIVGSGRKLLDQLNTIKSIADTSGRTHGLCGTYELIPFRNLNGQLSRRSIEVHLGRYHAQDKKQQQAFINVLFTFQEHLPLAKTPDLVSKWDYFYERSIGCVGVLKDWLTYSLGLALENKSPTLALEHLEYHEPSVAQCTTRLREAIDGERELQESKSARIALRTTLGLESKTLNKEPKSSSTNEVEEAARSVVRRGKRRVGSRNPKRDKVGLNSYD
jgi:hypothetical protein